MLFFLKYESGENCQVFQFTNASDAQAHIQKNLKDVVWIAYAQEPLKDGEDSPDFFAYDNIEAANEAIDRARVEMW